MTGAIEDLIFAIQRNGKDRLWAPFERLLSAIRQPDDCRAEPRERVDEHFVEVLDGTCFLAGSDFDDIIRHEVTAPVRMGKAAACVITRPRSGLEREKIMSEIKVDRRTLIPSPIHIRIE